jgi:outer membrane protein insertion porin family
VEKQRIAGLGTWLPLLLILTAHVAPLRAQAPMPATGPDGAGQTPAAPAPGPAPSTAPPAAPVQAPAPSPAPASDMTPSPAAAPTPGTRPNADASFEAPVPDATGDELPVTDAAPPVAGGRIVYVLERIEIIGNTTRDAVIRRFVPLKPGDVLDVDDPAIEQIRFRLMGSGWFDEVHLRLEKGSQRGRVVLIIEVEERNTLVISRVVAGLARVVTSSTSRDDELRPYAGLGLTENNLFGTGIGVSGAAVVSESQYGLAVGYHDPMRLGSGFDLGARAFYNHARDFFGREPSVSINCPVPDPMNPEPCDPDVDAERAVVIYNRLGVGFGTGHDITSSLRYEVDWLGELIDVVAKPAAADTLLGAQDQERHPIDFHIDDGKSYVSSLHFGLIFDRRDDPALPSRGQLLRFDTRIGTSLLGSTYDFARFEGSFRHFQPLPWHHVISFGAYVGTVFGAAPFFYRFYAADLSDLLPSRALELNLDFRRTHNLLGTSIREFDKEDLAARIDFEYELPLHRGSGDIRGIDAYAGAGLFLLGDRAAMRAGLPGYEGLSRVPVDLTFDLGVQADTSLGVFKIGFSSLIGFFPDLGQESQ